MPLSRHASTVPAALTLACTLASAVAAQDRTEETEANTQTVAEGTASAAADEGRKKADVIIAPAPFGSPTSGLGLAGGVVALYNPNGTPHQWITGGGIAWTTRGTKAVAGFHEMSSPTDAFRLRATVSYSDQQTKFYGIGADDGDRGDPLPLRNKQFGIKLQASWRVFPNVYAGVSYRLATNDAAPSEDDDEPPSTTRPPPEDQLRSTLSMIGPTLAYDTRDSHTQPTDGVQLTAGWLVGVDLLGNTYDHDKLTLTGSAYFRLSPSTVIAAGGTMCSAHGDVPYYDLCLFGAASYLRGYPSGRYRDRASWAVQGEVRRRFAKRWGGVAFVGVGGIAPSPGDFIGDGNLLPAAGIGVRYLLFKNNDAHVRFDVAKGKNDHGFYLGFGEAF